MTTLPLAAVASSGAAFPRALETYADAEGAGLWSTLAGRVAAEPFNLVATGIFVLAILHTFLAGSIRHQAHLVEERHAALLRARRQSAGAGELQERNRGIVPDEVSFLGQVLHFFGEIEVVFGLWAVVLGIAIAFHAGVDTAIGYFSGVNYTEPLFVFIIMAMAASRPVIALAESGLRRVAALGGGTVFAWWTALLVLTPILGSFITEPAAMTVGALLLARQFYAYQPGARLRYATIGLLFVNISVGGTLTHFAAPPVLMVAGPWGWGLAHMALNFGWKAVIGILIATALYAVLFRRELISLSARTPGTEDVSGAGRPSVPAWVTATHLGFLAWTVWAAHYPVLFIGGFLFYVGFLQATAHHQTQLDLRGPLLVGFFLAGLVVHGGLQGWWIAPVLSGLAPTALFWGATLLTAFNDNAAITYLATLVPGFSDAAKYAVVAGAVTGGGLTVIANAPNPAGLSVLQRFFPEGFSPVKLAIAAILPTLVMAACFLLL
ncbi:hypothetical protein EBZ70_05795 [bacterium]|nr:hypothetical protein [bacterium]